MNKRFLHIINFFVFSFLIVISSWFYSNYIIENTLIKNSHDHLKSMAHLRSDHIETFLAEEGQRAWDFSSDWLIRDSLSRMSEGENFSNVKNRLDKHLTSNIIGVDEDIYHLIVLDFEGNVAGTTSSDTVIENDFNEEIFEKGKENLYVKEIFYDEEFRRNGIAFSAPVYDGNDFLGIVVVKRTPSGLINLVSEKIGLKESEFIYVINSEGYLLTPSRFLSGENKGILTQVADSESVNMCLSDIGKPQEDRLMEHGGERDAMIFRDYRGEYVVSAHWLTGNGGWCVLAEIEMGEVLKDKLGALELMIALAFAAIASILFGFFAGNYSSKFGK